MISFPILTLLSNSNAAILKVSNINIKTTIFAYSNLRVTEVFQKRHKHIMHPPSSTHSDSLPMHPPKTLKIHAPLYSPRQRYSTNLGYGRGRDTRDPCHVVVRDLFGSQRVHPLGVDVGSGAGVFFVFVPLRFVSCKRWRMRHNRGLGRRRRNNR